MSDWVYGTMQAKVCVYLFTYRRHVTLERALKSLIEQDFVHWRCELHNDDPEDSFPKELVRKCNDSRIAYIHHASNLGALRSFNLAFQPVAEPFISILEDDNWWERNFLSTMIEALERHPEVSVSWANMWVWKEIDDGSWEKTKTIWPIENEPPITLFSFPDPRQVCGMLHSQGAMLVRATSDVLFSVPETLPVFAIEAVRERRYPSPLMLLHKPLANFSITKITARDETADQNLQILILLALSFMNSVQLTPHFLLDILMFNHGSRRHILRALIMAAGLAGKLHQVWNSIPFTDWALVVGWILRHPFRARMGFRAPENFPDVYDFLTGATMSQNFETKS